MQQSQFFGEEAAQGAPSWYLARGDKKYGPLGDRELLLLAERGGLKPDDFLWKTGFAVPFFAFREIARVVGEAEFRILMLGSANSPLARQAVPALPAASA
jgi:hypothetical protein